MSQEDKKDLVELKPGNAGLVVVKDESNSKALIKVDISIEEFNDILDDITKNSSVMALKEHEQHHHSSRYDHCHEVAYYTYVICKKLGLDYISATRGAMLHDFYFYDWRNKNVDGQKTFHAFRHPRIALNNATDNFDLNDVEKDVIVKHMWPLTFVLPRYAESYIVTLVDKYCATKDFFGFYRHQRHIKKMEKLDKLSKLHARNNEK